MSNQENYDPAVPPSLERQTDTHGLVLTLLEQNQGYVVPPNSPIAAAEVAVWHDQELQLSENNVEELIRQVVSAQSMLAESYTMIARLLEIRRVTAGARREFIESIITREEFVATELMCFIRHTENQIRELQMVDENIYVDIAEPVSLPSLVIEGSNSSRYLDSADDMESETEEELSRVAGPRNTR